MGMYHRDGAFSIGLQNVGKGAVQVRDNDIRQNTPPQEHGRRPVRCQKDGIRSLQLIQLAIQSWRIAKYNNAPAAHPGICFG